MPVGGRVRRGVGVDFFGDASARDGIDRLMENTRFFVAKQTLKFIEQLQDTLQEETPFLSGWASANWIPEAGRRRRSRRFVNRLRYDQRYKWHDAAVESGDAEIGQALPSVVKQQQRRQAIARHGVRLAFMEGKEMPKTVTIRNYCAYIAKLNRGYSDQAPALFIENAIRRTLSSFK